MMLNGKILAIFLMVAGSCSATVQSNYYEETLSYFWNPQCKPSKFDKGIQCSAGGPTITVAGGIYDTWGPHYMPLASAYYVSRFADALGYQADCPTNKTFLKELNIVSPWSGSNGAIAVDMACGFKRVVPRTCSYPANNYPFLCQGGEGNPPTFGKRLETLSYISVLQGSNLRWVLFINCWNAKTPRNPNAKEIATSFNVFSVDPTLSASDRALIIAELGRRGFNTDPSNIIEFDFSTTKC